MAFKTSDAAANAMLTTLNQTIGENAIIEIYTGPQPSTEQPTGQRLAYLVGQTEFGTVANRTLTANPIIRDDAADATGTAGYIRLSTKEGVVVADLAVGSEVTMPTTSITEGQPVEINAITIRIP